ncbi:hypothetical protein Acr_25g0005460 [Actinidia rufa]|uniref:Uncharacterized protein n=1 Tax=Actinidia rufa TaxID=165716 RepID=A0A7J0GZ72_9ERIC|nr:hypothetical protein Acr_25g0005460 [Actinidia rufa]
MPEPQVQAPTNQNLSKRPKNKSVSAGENFKPRKIRVICSDPYATDSSDDELTERPYGPKRMVQEITLCDLGRAKTPETYSSCDDSNINGEKSPEEEEGFVQNPESKLEFKARATVSDKSLNRSSMTESNPEDNHPAVSEDSVSLLPHKSPSSVLELDSPASTSLINAEKYSETVKDFGVETNFDENEVPMVEEPLGLDLGVELDLDSMFMDDFGLLLDDFCSLDDFQIHGFDDNEPTDLPDFDFDLGNEELSCWID